MCVFGLETLVDLAAEGARGAARSGASSRPLGEHLLEYAEAGKLLALREMLKLVSIDMQTVEGMTTGSRAQLQCRAILEARRIELEVGIMKLELEAT